MTDSSSPLSEKFNNLNLSSEKKASGDYVPSLTLNEMRWCIPIQSEGGGEPIYRQVFGRYVTNKKGNHF